MQMGMRAMNPQTMVNVGIPRHQQMAMPVRGHLGTLLRSHTIDTIGPLIISGSFLAEISVSSPRKLFDFVI